MEEKKRFSIPKQLRFPLIWTIFFAILGIIIQSLEANTFVFSAFFSDNYIIWLKSFGDFINPTIYSNFQAVLFSILKTWYYFFFTGGLISIIWGLIAWFVNLSFSPRQQKTQNVINKTKMIEELLKEGHEALYLKDLDRARQIYKQISREYNSSDDTNQFLREKIMEFYWIIVNDSKPKELSRTTNYL